MAVVTWKFDKDLQRIVVDRYVDKKKEAEEDKSLPVQCNYSFHVVRYKDEATLIEKIVITCYEKYNRKFKDGVEESYEERENGVVETDLINLNKDLNTFKMYGVSLRSSDFDTIGEVIEEEYPNIDITNVNTGSAISKNELLEILRIIKGYTLDILNDTNVTEVNLTIAEFNELFVDTDFEDYDTLLIRKELLKKGYIIANNGRTSRLVRAERASKPTRMISFDVQKLRGVK